MTRYLIPLVVFVILVIFLGIGLNVRIGAYPPELAATATSIAEQVPGPPPTLEMLLAALSGALVNAVKASTAASTTHTHASAICDRFHNLLPCRKSGSCCMPSIRWWA